MVVVLCKCSLKKLKILVANLINKFPLSAALGVHSDNQVLQSEKWLLDTKFKFTGVIWISLEVTVWVVRYEKKGQMINKQ